MAKKRATAHHRELPKETHPRLSAADVATIEPNGSSHDEVDEEHDATSSDDSGVKQATAEKPDATPVTAKKTASRQKRVLDVFFVDSGWNSPVCSAVRENLPAVAEYLHGHRFYTMTPEQSTMFIRHHPALIGEDPMLVVLDRVAAGEKIPNRSYGFRLSMGSVRNPETAVSMMKWAVQLAVTANTAEMAKIISKSAHRETLQGVIEMMGEGSTHLIEFAPL
jgi:hypothetical protein